MTKEQLVLEELSTAIDALNARCKVLTPDPEVKDLIKIAGLVKEYGQSDTEKAIIQQMTHTISADIVGRRRRKQLITACAGVAAAILLFVGASVKIPFQPPAQIAREEAKGQIETGVDNPQPSEEREIAKISKESGSTPTSRDNGKTAVLEQDKRQQVVEEKPLTVAVAPKRELAPSSQASKQANTSRIEATSPPQTMLMVLPDRTADLVSSEASGTVRQVYGKNTDKEIILTQRPGNKNPVDKAARTSASLAKSGAPALNKTTRQLKGLEVVIEGVQPQAELERVADSLIPSDHGSSVPPANVEKKQKEE